MFFSLNNTKIEKNDIHERLAVTVKILWGTNKVNNAPYLGKACGNTLVSTSTNLF